MTEDEAKTKWCPMVCIGATQTWEHIRGHEYSNRTTDDNEFDFSTRCIGSKCCAWRWAMSPEAVAQVNARGNAGAKPSGFCGLAGKP